MATWKSTYTFIVTIGDLNNPDDGGDLTFTVTNIDKSGSGEMDGITSKTVTAVSAVRVTEASGGGGGDDGADPADNVQTRPSSKLQVYRNGVGGNPN